MSSSNPNKTDIQTGLSVPAQIPLDYIKYSPSESILSSLGLNDNLAFTYYDKLIVHCREEDTKWEWRVGTVAEVGLVAQNFTYPLRWIVDDVNYSGKEYNFYKLTEAKDLFSTINEITEATGAYVTGNDIVFNPEWKWIIANIPYSNPVEETITIPLSSTDYSRLVYFVPNVSNSFDMISGEESLGEPFAPVLPNGGIYATWVKVTDTGISEPIMPIIGDNYITKTSKGGIIFDFPVSYGHVPFVDIPTEKSLIQIAGGATSLGGVNIIDEGLDEMYEWKDFYVFNYTGAPFTIYDYSSPFSGGAYKFAFTEGKDLVMKYKEIAHFKARQTAWNSYFLCFVGILRNTISDIEGLEEELDKIPKTYAKNVFFNFTNPNSLSATIFDLNNPPTVNDDSLRLDSQNLYIGNNNSTWVYNSSTSLYEPEVITSEISNFLLAGPEVDAGNNKTNHIFRYGGISIGTNIFNLSKFLIRSLGSVLGIMVDSDGTTASPKSRRLSWFASNSVEVAYIDTPDERTNTNAVSMNFATRNSDGTISIKVKVNKDGSLNVPNLAGTGSRVVVADSSGNLSTSDPLSKTEIAYACSDEFSPLMVGDVITFRVPFAMTLSEVRTSLNTAPTVSSLIVNVKENGVSIFSTLLSIDATEKTSVTAAVPAVISDVNLANDSEIIVSVTQIGSGVAGAGLKILFIGKKV
jgi:hypothetical protein